MFMPELIVRYVLIRTVRNLFIFKLLYIFYSKSGILQNFVNIFKLKLGTQMTLELID